VNADVADVTSAAHRIVSTSRWPARSRERRRIDRDEAGARIPQWPGDDARRPNTRRPDILRLDILRPHIRRPETTKAARGGLRFTVVAAMRSRRAVRLQRWRALKRGFDLQITKTLPRRRTTLQSR